MMLLFLLNVLLINFKLKTILVSGDDLTIIPTLDRLPQHYPIFGFPLNELLLALTLPLIKSTMKYVSCKWYVLCLVRS